MGPSSEVSTGGALDAAIVPAVDGAVSLGSVAGRRPRFTRAAAVKLGASLLLIAYILSRADLTAVAQALRSVAPGWIAVALGLQVVGVAIVSLRWRGLLAAKSVAPGWAYLFKSTMVSAFFRQFLPTIVGGDVIRGYDAWRAGARPGLALMSLVLDRLLGMLALAVVAVVGIMALDRAALRIPAIGLWAVLAVLVLAAAIAQIVRPLPVSVRMARAVIGRTPAGARGRIGNVAAALGSYRDAQGVLAAGFALSVALQLNVVTFYWALGQALGLPVDYLSFFVIVPVAVLVMMLPISINGIGVREGVFIFLLAQWGVHPAHALALAWLEYGISLFFGLVGGGLYALRRR